MMSYKGTQSVLYCIDTKHNTKKTTLINWDVVLLLKMDKRWYVLMNTWIDQDGKWGAKNEIRDHNPDQHVKSVQRSSPTMKMFMCESILMLIQRKE